ncbi:MAG: hypothetical protein ACYCYA_01690 [Actinomycetes bacterium]
MVGRSVLVAGLAGVLVAVGLVVPVGAWAQSSAPGVVGPLQSPAPGLAMEDPRPYNGWPPGNVSAEVIEGVGMLGTCAQGSTYSYTSVTNQTATTVAYGFKTVTEVTPQSGCGSISAYETAFTNMVNDVVAYAGASMTADYWAGIMLDEEPGYGFSPSQLETLNSYVDNLMSNVAGLPWYFGEDSPVGWGNPTGGLAIYNAVLGNATPAPQAYSSAKITRINAECATYGNCTNLVTVDTQLSGSYGEPVWVTGQVNGSPWAPSQWGGYAYYNDWRPQ